MIKVWFWVEYDFVLVEVYLTRPVDNQNDIPSEPYTEEYNSVAVMFASILPVVFGDTSDIGEVGDPDKTLLTVMNEIISDFDMVSFFKLNLIV